MEDQEAEQFVDGHRCAGYEPSIVASSTSMIGISSLTAYTRLHCTHFKLSGAFRYSNACLHAGHTKISNNSFAIMQALYAKAGCE